MGEGCKSRLTDRMKPPANGVMQQPSVQNIIALKA